MDSSSDIMRSTEKLYYKNQYLNSVNTTVVCVHHMAIELQSTVAYPEGGGQESDVGTIELPIGKIRFVWAKKIYGTPIHRDGFKGGKLGGIILHMIHPDDAHWLAHVSAGMRARVNIDSERRERLTLSHTASHFLYIAATHLRPELKKWTLGCHIKEDSARFDFLVDSTLSVTDISEIKNLANSLIIKNEVILNCAVDGIEDVRMWSYSGIDIPCGGTHLERPYRIGLLNIRRKRLGKNKERLICEYPDAQFDLSRYHE